jgi:hypothetical protein
MSSMQDYHTRESGARRPRLSYHHYLWARYVIDNVGTAIWHGLFVQSRYVRMIGGYCKLVKMLMDTVVLRIAAAMCFKDHSMDPNMQATLILSPLDDNASTHGTLSLTFFWCKKKQATKTKKEAQPRRN